MWRLNFQDRGARDTARAQYKARGTFAWIAAGPGVRPPSASGSVRNEVLPDEGPWEALGQTCSRLELETCAARWN